MTSERPRMALLGCGQWGLNLARNLAKLGVLRTICDLNPAAVQRIRKIYSESTTVTPQQVFDDPQIDACVIATPAASRASTSTSSDW